MTFPRRCLLASTSGLFLRCSLRRLASFLLLQMMPCHHQVASHPSVLCLFFVPPHSYLSPRLIFAKAPEQLAGHWDTFALHQAHEYAVLLIDWQFGDPGRQLIGRGAAWHSFAGYSRCYLDEVRSEERRV